MADDSLKSRRNSCGPLLLVHCRRSLPASASGGLSIQILWLIVLPWLLGLHHTHLLPIWLRCLSWVGWRSAPLVRTVHVIVHALLSMRVLLSVLVHLHVGICRMLCSLGLLCCDNLLLLLLTLSAHAFVTLLLLNARRR